MIFHSIKRRMAFWYIRITLRVRRGKGSYLFNNIYGGQNYFSQNSTVKNSTIGFLSYAGSNTRIENTTIGKYSSIGPNVLIGLGEHPVDRMSTHPIFYKAFRHVNVKLDGVTPFQEYYKTHIGSDCWIGANVIVRAGVEIGNGAIIAAGSVVTKDVPPFHIFGGNPAKFIRKRFDEETISELQNICWWDWDLQKIQENLHRFKLTYTNTGEPID